MFDQRIDSFDCLLLTPIKGVLRGYFRNLTNLPTASLWLRLEMNEIVPNSIHFDDSVRHFM